jgi:tetratricopeptide (TPR) repeat protein
MKLWNDAYCAGFYILASPRYCNNRDSAKSNGKNVTETILAQMQGIAMQLAKQYPLRFSTSWAAQTALWQWEHAAASSSSSSENPSSSQLFLRLAESLALKALDHPNAKGVMGAGGDSSSSTLEQTETFLIYLRALEHSGRHDEVLAAVEARLEAAGVDVSSDARAEDEATNQPALVYPPRRVLLDRKAQVLQDMGRYRDARVLIEQELLNSYPDDWSYWKRHLQCAVGEAGPDGNGIGTTEAFVSEVLEMLEGRGGAYPLRGPHLMRVEVAAERFRTRSCCDPDELVQEIVSYGTRFSSQAACTFSDVLPYVDLLLLDTDASRQLSSRDTLLEWTRELGAPPSSSDPKERRKELRTYIFSTQMCYKLVTDAPVELRREWIPHWVAVLSVWKSFQPFDRVTEDDQVSHLQNPPGVKRYTKRIRSLRALLCRSLRRKRIVLRTR